MEKFNYVVGRPWYPEKPDSSVGAYTYGGQVHYGDESEAEVFRQYCDRQLSYQERKENPYRIYKLVEIKE